MDAVTIFANAMADSFTKIAIRNGYRGDTLDCGRASDILKQVANAALDDVLKEWNAAIDASMGDPFLRSLLSAQAATCAAQAWNLYVS